VWRTLHDEIEAELSRIGEFGSVSDIGAKVAENAARIAALFHVLTQGPGGDIDCETMNRAATLGIWHLNEARRVVGATTTPQDIADAALLEEWLLSRPDMIEPRDILRLGPAPLRDKKRRDASIKVLVEKHRAQLMKVGCSEKLIVNGKLRPGK
jgi:putative DNA primase/helicase